MKKYSKIKRIGHDDNDGILDGGELAIVEKMDGANFRFQLDDEHDKLLFGSRNVEYKDNGVPEHPDDDGNSIQDNFVDVCNYLLNNVDKDTIREIEDRYDAKLTFFGENMVRHTLDYNWDAVPRFLGFDVYNEDEEEYLPLGDVLMIFKDLGLKTAPVIDTVSADEFDPTEYEVPESNWRDGKAEGVVIRNEDNGIKAKLRTEEFKEKNQQAFGGRRRSPEEVVDKMREELDKIDENAPDDVKHGQMKNCVNQIKKIFEKNRETDNDELVATYCTDARIKKHIHKLEDEGHDLDKSLMQHLPVRVTRDIVEEEANEIFCSGDNTIRTKDFRSQVAKRCLKVIEKEMTNRAINEA